MESIHGELIYTGKGIVKDAWLTFNGNRIAGISKMPKGERLGEFPVLTPAFIDAHCHIGMNRSGEPSLESESNEHLDSIAPLPDALDSVMMDDSSLKESVEAGVLYSCVVPGSGNIIGGRSAVIRNYARNTTEAFITRAGIKGALGYNTSVASRDWKGARPYTRMGALSLLRKKLDEVRLKLEKMKRAPAKERRGMALTAEESLLRDLLERKERLRVHAHKVDDLACLMRVAEEFKLDVSVEHSMDVDAPHIYEELRKRKIPVVFGPIDCFSYKTELRHASWRNIRHLLDSKVEFGLMTDHPVMLQRELFLQLRHFLRFDMSKADAIGIITLRNATILGMDKQLGSLERGKWASFAAWTGDPFELTSYPAEVYGEGNLLHREG